jgi:hypothetical protein
MNDRSLGTRSMIAGAVLALVLVNWRDIVSSLPRVARAFATVMESASSEQPGSPRVDSAAETVSWESRIDERRVADREIVPAAKPIFDAGDALPAPAPVRFPVADEVDVTRVAALDPRPIVTEIVLVQPPTSAPATPLIPPSTALGAAAASPAPTTSPTLTIVDTLPPEILGLFISEADKEKQPTQNHMRRGFLSLKFNAVLPGQIEVRLGQRTLGPIHVGQPAGSKQQEVDLPIAFPDCRCARPKSCESSTIPMTIRSMSTVRRRKANRCWRTSTTRRRASCPCG